MKTLKKMLCILLSVIMTVCFFALSVSATPSSPDTHIKLYYDNELVTNIGDSQMTPEKSEDEIPAVNQDNTVSLGKSNVTGIIKDSKQNAAAFADDSDKAKAVSSSGLLSPALGDGDIIIIISIVGVLIAAAVVFIIVNKKKKAENTSY